MKFITEGDLRDLYNKEPFTAFDLESEARLTPGARQFLLDRKIEILGSDSVYKKINISLEQSAAVTKRKHNWEEMMLYSKLNSIEALFLLTGEELLRKDVCLAQKTIQLNKQVSSIKNTIKNKCTVENLYCNECAGINEDNFSDHLDDCIEITEFYIQLERGREILLLHRLRCALQEIEPLVLEYRFDNKEENRMYQDMVCKVNQIVNSLSQLICSLIGGGKCLLKS